jgi:hypothetical protein
LRFFRHFPQGLERSNPHENYPHKRKTCWASCHARRLAQQVALVCGGLNRVAFRVRPNKCIKFTLKIFIRKILQ